MGPDHPAKLRIWNFINRICGFPRLTVPFAKGGWISLDIRDCLEFWVLRDGDYEPEVWEALKQFAAAKEVVWDVGAHVGIFGIKAVLDPKVSKTYCFEPHPETFRALTANLNLNRAAGDFKALPFGLGSKAETLPLYEPDAAKNTGLTGFTPIPNVPSVKVKVETMDQLVESGALEPPTLMKLDVEGWELAVLQGGEKTVSHPRLKAIVFEAECDPSANILNKALPDFLEAKGFKIKWLPRPEISIRENYLAWR